MTTIAVRVPRGSLLSANGRGHYMARSTASGVLRSRAFRAWVLAGRPHHERVSCICVVTYPDRRRRDVTNLAPTAKALIDGMVCGPRGNVGGNLLPDDDDLHLIGPDMRAGDEIGEPGGFTFAFSFEELP